VDLSKIGLQRYKNKIIYKSIKLIFYSLKVLKDLPALTVIFLAERNEQIGMYYCKDVDKKE
jgi:hypothetical protein